MSRLVPRSVAGYPARPARCLLGRGRACASLSWLGLRLAALVGVRSTGGRSFARLLCVWPWPGRWWGVVASTLQLRPPRSPVFLVCLLSPAAACSARWQLGHGLPAPRCRCGRGTAAAPRCALAVGCRCALAVGSLWRRLGVVVLVGLLGLLLLLGLFLVVCGAFCRGFWLGLVLLGVLGLLDPLGLVVLVWGCGGFVLSPARPRCLRLGGA